MSLALKIILTFATFVFTWTLLVLLLTAQLSYDGSDWSTNLVISTRQAIPWIITSPIIILLSFWFPLVHTRWLINTMIHISLCILFLLGVSRIRQTLNKRWPIPVIKETRITTRKKNKTTSTIQQEDIQSGQTIEIKKTLTKTPEKQITQIEIIHSVSRTAPLGIPLYTSIVLLASLMRYREKVISQDKAAMRLETQLTQTQLNLLRSQLQPHFLFNTLNSISSLVHTDPDKADSMVIQLSHLLRSTLEHRDASFIPLKLEIATIESYLKIQSTRFGDRISIKKSIDPKTLDLPVPPMILLPLAENAVRYGVEKSRKKTTITLKSKRYTNKLVLSIIDDGPGLDHNEKGGTGVGLTNTANRLLTLYPEGSATIDLLENEAGCTVASIQLPLLDTPND